MKKNNKGFVVSAVLYPLLVLFLALIMGLLAMTDTRKRILDKMKLEISDSIFDEATCSCDTILNKLNYLIKNGVSGGGGGGSYTYNVLGLNVKKYESPSDMPNVGNSIGDIAMITESISDENYQKFTYFVSKDAPEEPKEGQIWIVQDITSKYYIKSDYSKIGIGYAMEYYNGQWVLRKTYVYNEGKWQLLYYVPMIDGEVDLGGSDINSTVQWNYDYTGEYQTFTAPFSGYYQMELWGAQGGSYNTSSAAGGLGSYTSGKIYLDAGTTLYVFVGGTGSNPTAYDVAMGGGWNGGGNGLRSSNTGNNIAAMGGGGSTDIRLMINNEKGKDVWNDFDSLKSRIMVAAGGSGGSRYSDGYTTGRPGGGLIGYEGTCDGGTCGRDIFLYGGFGGTQSKAGYNLSNSTADGGFGYGGSGVRSNYNSTGAGSGYYGGAGAYAVGNGRTVGATGSSYISGFTGCNSIDQDSTENNIVHIGTSYHYSGYYFTNTTMIDGAGYKWNSYKAESIVERPKANGNTVSGNGYAIITLVSVDYDENHELTNNIKEEEEKVWAYQYSGEYQIFSAPYSGYYKAEAWGAQGGSYNTSSAAGGLGAYTSGEIFLEKGEKLYIYVGGVGSNPTAYNVATGGGWNGGGNGLRSSSNSSYNIAAEGGGGATDIRLIPTSSKEIWNEFESLKSRIMVAAGGSGGTRYSDGYSVGSPGGGLTGYEGTCDSGTCGRNIFLYGGFGGTQSKAGYNLSNSTADGGFGYGGSGVRSNYNSTGAGSGYYGGAGAYAVGNGRTVGATGSSYISGYEGCNSIKEESTSINIIHTGSAYHYSGKYFNNTQMIDGAGYKWNTATKTTIVNQPTYDGLGTQTGNSGNGYAKITLLSKSNQAQDEVKAVEKKWMFGYSGNYETFIAPLNGYYDVQLWGAQGGSYNTGNAAGGLGSYTSGKIYLEKGDILYLYVGGTGSNPTAYDVAMGAGWNGGGNGLRSSNTSNNMAAEGGGGATDIRLVATSARSNWSDFESLKSRIMVAAGGSGGSRYGDGYTAGSPGGGLNGYEGACDGGTCGILSKYSGSGGTQNAPGFSEYSKDATIGGFGYGGDSPKVNYNGTGSGGGYYGGGGAYAAGNGRTVAGSGSSYISGHNGCNSIIEDSSETNIIHNGSKVHYSGYTFTNTQIIDGSGYKWGEVIAEAKTDQPTYDSENTQVGNSGNGFAIIELSNKTDVRPSSDKNETRWEYSFNENYQIFIAPYSGYYSMELWGAQGGSYNTSNSIGGLGSYTYGEIYLTEGTKLYVYVGGKGTNPTAYQTLMGAGWNGGGNGVRENTSYSHGAGGGGGSTDIRLSATSSKEIWNEFNSLKSRIMVAAGGSGSTRWGDSYYNGIGGGGLTGYDGTCDGGVCSTSPYNGGTKGTQTYPGYTERYIIDSAGGFGYGGDAHRCSYSASGSGGGYYGGGGASGCSNGSTIGGTGSSYISGFEGVNSISEDSTIDDIRHIGSKIHYSGYYFDNAVMIDGKGYSWNATTTDSKIDQPTYTNEEKQVGNSGSGHASIKLISRSEQNSKNIIEKRWAYTYSGSYQTFTAPDNGYYSIELWGAQGGSYNTSNSLGGLGSYTYGEIYLEKGTKLYVYVGGQGMNPLSTQTLSGGGWNGGGNGVRQNSSYSYGAAGGGGATDVRLAATSSKDIWDEFDSLKSRIMVAAGGSGSTNWNGTSYNGMAGGGINGYDGLCDASVCSIDINSINSGYGAKQNSAGYNPRYIEKTLGGFGYGGDAYQGGNSASGGGGGYYGGGGASGISNGGTHGGSGSSYISGFAGSSSIDETSRPDDIIHTGSAIHYSGYYFKNSVMIDGKGYNWNDSLAETIVGQPTYDGKSVQTGNSGNGYAVIKQISIIDKTSSDLETDKLESENTWNYSYSGNYQVFVAPKTGDYRIELWGAQGGSYNSNGLGGKGSYTKGEITLTAGTKLYIYVGGQGRNAKAYQTFDGAGWNGGGDGMRQNTSYSYGAGGGGGATDVRTKVTSSLDVWQETISLSSRIMVAAGGSGSTNWNGTSYNGSAGGGLNGYDGLCDASICGTNFYGGKGGTQTSAGNSPIRETCTQGAFGVGGSGCQVSNSASGGGSGWYGGGGASGVNNGGTQGGGGSSYISGHAGCIGVNASGLALSDTYSEISDSISNTGYKFTKTVMIDGKGYQWTTEVGTSVLGQPTYDGKTTQVGNSGNGYAKISYLGEA